MRWAPSLVAAALLALASPAGAQPAPPSLLPRAELDYRVAPGLDCPPEEDVRAEIVKEMGGDPFSVRGPSVALFHVVVSPNTTEALSIDVSFDDVTGKRSFKTSFQGSHRSTTCGHLMRTHVVGEIVMELTVQMSRKFRAQLAGASAAGCSSGSGSTPAACTASRFDLWPEDWPSRLPKPKPDPPPPPERRPVAVRVGLAVWPETVASDWGSVGFSAEAGFRYRAFSAGVEVHGDPPLGSVAYPQAGTVSFARVSGALLACAHYGLFVGCGLGDVGRFIFPNHVPQLPASALYSAVGVRAGLEFRIPNVSRRLFIRTSVDVRGPIHPASFSTTRGNIFEAAGLGLGLGFVLLAELAP